MVIYEVVGGQGEVDDRCRYNYGLLYAFEGSSIATADL